MSSNYSVIILAAGLSSRMGNKNKLLLPFRHTTVIEHVMNQITSTFDQRIIVVLGHQHESVREALQDYKVDFVYNENYRDGMTTSIQCGVALAENSLGYLVFLGDMPLISNAEYEKVLAQIQQTEGKRIIRPVHSNTPGHPIFFSNHFKEDLLTHTNPDGCRDIIKENSSYLLQFEMNNDSIVRDMDTEKDYLGLM